MKILVTGNRGFIGSNMVNMLWNKHQVYTYEWGDSEPDVKGLDWVIHMGAITSTTEIDVEKVLNQNYDFSVRLLNKCLNANVNFQFSSSASIYGLNDNFREDAVPDPRTPYAWSKLLFERHALSNRILDYAKDACIKIQCFRYFNVYGPNEDHKGDQASPYHKFKKQYETDGVIRVFENSQNYLRDFIPVERVCQTHIDFFNVPESGLWNVGTGVATSFLDVARSITDNVSYISMPKNLQNSYQAYTCADMTKTNNTLKKYAMV